MLCLKRKATIYISLLYHQKLREALERSWAGQLRGKGDAAQSHTPNTARELHFSKPKEKLSLLGSSWHCPSRERRGANSSEDTTGNISLPALTNSHPSPPWAFGKCWIRVFFACDHPNPSSPSCEPWGEQGQGSGLAHVTVIGEGHREGTRGDYGGIYQLFQGGGTAPERLLINARGVVEGHRKLVIFRRAARDSSNEEIPKC